MQTTRGVDACAPCVHPQALLLFLLGPGGEAGKGRRPPAPPSMPPELVRTRVWTSSAVRCGCSPLPSVYLPCALHAASWPTPTLPPHRAVWRRSTSRHCSHKLAFLPTRGMLLACASAAHDPHDSSCTLYCFHTPCVDRHSQQPPPHVSALHAWLSSSVPTSQPCRHQHPTVTPAGLRFLLLDTYQQLWALLRQYMSAAVQGPQGSLSGAVSFLLQLGFRATGRPWALASIPPEFHSIAGSCCVSRVCLQAGLLPAQQ